MKRTSLTAALKKIGMLALGCVFALSLVGCAGNSSSNSDSAETPEEQTEEAQPEDEQAENSGPEWTSVKSMAKARKMAGFGLQVPSGIKQVFPTMSFSAIKKAALEVRCTNGTSELNIRKILVSANLPENYAQYTHGTSTQIAGVTVELLGDENGVSTGVWTDGEYKYSVSLEEATAGSDEPIEDGASAEESYENLEYYLEAVITANK